MTLTPFVWIAAGALLFAKGGIAETFTDPQSRSGVWEGLMTDASQGDVNIRLFLTIETEGRAADGTFRITSISGQIRHVSFPWPQALNDGYCNLDTVKANGYELRGSCLPGWRPTVEPKPVSLDFEATYRVTIKPIPGGLHHEYGMGGGSVNFSTTLLRTTAGPGGHPRAGSRKGVYCIKANRVLP